MVDSQSQDPGPPQLGRCPTCKSEADPVFRPFCSKRCADIDLHRWFSGAYAIPDESTPVDEDGHDPDDQGP